MFRVLDVPRDGAPVIVEGAERVAPPDEGAFRWIDLVGQDTATLELLREKFGFHPLALEDCAHLDQRPKLEEYGDHLFIVTHGFICSTGQPGDVKFQEVHAFLGKRWLVTVHDEPVAPLETVWKRAASDPVLARKGADFLYYLVADALVDANFPILDQLEQAIEDVEDKVLHDPSQRDLRHMFEIKRTLVLMRRVLSPQRDVFGLLSKRGDARIEERTALYFRDVYDHLVRITETIETGRDLLGNALDAYLSSLSNRTNEIMKRLTILSAVFLPLTFLTGYFGQNFEDLPVKSHVLPVLVTAACLVIPAGMLWWFRRSRWL
jgi:magnesium transporter